MISRSQPLIPGLTAEGCSITSGPPALFAPLDPSEFKKLKGAKVEELPARLQQLLHAHRTPVHHLFRYLDGNLDGMLTRSELWTNLRTLGLDLSRSE